MSAGGRLRHLCSHPYSDGHAGDASHPNTDSTQGSLGTPTPATDNSGDLGTSSFSACIPPPP